MSSPPLSVRNAVKRGDLRPVEEWMRQQELREKKLLRALESARVLLQSMDNEEITGAALTEIRDAVRAVRP